MVKASQSGQSGQIFKFGQRRGV